MRKTKGRMGKLYGTGNLGQFRAKAPPPIFLYVEAEAGSYVLLSFQSNSLQGRE
jgi:hypothetical protein